MMLARVVGPLVATQKHRKFEGSTLLLVQPLGENDTARGPVHEKVLIVLDGKAAGDAMKKKGAPVDAAIIGIVDHVDVS
jgi:ethanolamine utilization protein EutN